MSANSSVTTWEVVQANPDKPWNWSGLSYNVAWEVVQANPDKPWDWSCMSNNLSITGEFVKILI